MLCYSRMVKKFSLLVFIYLVVRFWSTDLFSSYPKEAKQLLEWLLTCPNYFFFFFFVAYSSNFSMWGSPTYIINAVIVTLLPGSVGLGLHLPGSPEPNSGCRSCFRQSRILAIRLPFVFNNTYTPRSADNTLTFK